MNALMHPACVGLRSFERSRSAQHIGRTRFRSPCIMMKRPRRFSLSARSSLRLIGSQYQNAAPTKVGSSFDRKWRTVQCCGLNIKYSLNVALQIARLYGWLESPLIVSGLLVALGTASYLDK